MTTASTAPSSSSSVINDRASDRETLNRLVRVELAERSYDIRIGTGLLDAAETYMANLEEAVARGVFGVPFYMVGDERFWGQDRLEDLDLHLSGKR